MSRSTCIPLYPATDGRQTGDDFVADTRYNVDGDKWVQVDTTCACNMTRVHAALNHSRDNSA